MNTANDNETTAPNSFEMLVATVVNGAKEFVDNRDDVCPLMMSQALIRAGLGQICLHTSNPAIRPIIEGILATVSQCIEAIDQVDRLNSGDRDRLN